MRAGAEGGHSYLIWPTRIVFRYVQLLSRSTNPFIQGTRSHLRHFPRLFLLVFRPFTNYKGPSTIGLSPTGDLNLISEGVPISLMTFETGITSA